MKTLKILLIIGIVSLTFYSFDLYVQEEWDIPDKYVKMKNPTYANKENLAIGKALYSKHCKSCHGKTGIGDGPKADEFDSDIGDFSSSEFHEQTEGEIFYKSYIGRDDMPNYEKKIPDPEDMWFIVNHLKTLEEYLKTLEKQ
jgi:mono/diheme cytochrome c family protein